MKKLITAKENKHLTSDFEKNKAELINERDSRIFTSTLTVCRSPQLNKFGNCTI